MFESLTNDDITAAIDGLVDSFGIKEEAPLSFPLILNQSEMQKCVEEVAAWLGLRIHVLITIVPKRYSPSGSAHFESSALVRGRDGHATEAIAAQVVIPEGLESRGLSGLSGYLFEIRVSEDCYEYPQTFVAVLGHELAHVLLTAVNHPAKDSEIHADLVPIVLGLRGFVTKGRTVYKTTSDGTRTTTIYGYLTDSQFQHAYNYASRVLERKVRGKRSLAISCDCLRRKIEAGRLEVDHFCGLCDYLDSHLPRRIGQLDGLRLVEFHRPGYVDGWEAGIAEARRFLERAETYVEELNHYFSNTADQIKKHDERLAAASMHMDGLVGQISGDIDVLERHMPFLFRKLGIGGPKTTQPG